MIKYIQCIFALLLCSSLQAQNGCTVLGQTPSTAFPVCGTTILSQTVIPNCSGKTIPVPACSDPLGTYADVRPFWYKFTCFKSGTLGFLIQPNTNNDDYDWQIFDVTGKLPDDVYTNVSLFVACNWSGNTGPTGANATGSKQNNCQGNTPNISAMPNLIQGHNYLMLVSNFSPSQSGYKLSFGGGTASITDTVTPKFSKATIACTGQTLSIKLNKLMKCKSLASNGSDFALSNGGVSITGATGVNCTTGFDMDSIVLTLSAPLPVGYAYLTAKNGSDGNTILDNCDNGIAIGDTLGFVVVSGVPAAMDSLSKAACSPKDITIKLSDYVRCSSIAADGSDFAISGPASVSIVKALGNCNANGLSNTIVVSLAQPINTGGLFTISLKKGTDGNTIVNDCSKETPVGSLLTFTTIDTVSAKFTYTIDSGCVSNTVHFKHDGNSGTNSWLWNFSNGSSSTLQNADIILPNSSTTTIKLTVSNGVCTNSYTDILVQKFDTVKAIFSTPASVCPTNSWSITNSSTGNIVSYNWDFGNGTTSTAKNPAPFAYALQTNKQIYNIRLIVANALGCKDTITHAIEVKGNPTVLLDSVIKSACAPQTITVRLNNLVSCGSLAADGSDFAISGPSAVSIKSASASCDANGLTNLILLTLAQPIKIGGTYTISTKVGSDGNILLNDCGIAVANGTTINFNTVDTVSAKFTYKIDSGCVNNTIHFSQAGLNNINQWNWNFGAAAAISTQQNPSITVPNASTVAVLLIVSNGICNDTSTQTIIQQFDTVKAVFDFPNPICPTTNWAITNNSTGKIVRYQWDFGNGTSSTLKNPLPYAYPISAQQNQYAIRLVVANALGCTDTLTKTVTVKANLPATLDSLSKAACKPQQLVLYFSGPIDCSSIAADGSDFNIIGTSPITITSAVGNCSAGFTNSITVNLSQPIYTAGAFAIYLKKGSDGNVLINDCGVESLAGGNLTFTTSDTVNAQFTYSITLGCNNDNIQFAHDGRNSVNQWAWKISDGRTTALQNPALAFPNAGNFTVQLAVTNGACSDVYTTPITLSFDTVQAIFEVPEFICPNEPWLISNTSTGKIVNYAWDFGSGVRSALQNPTNINYPIPTTVTQRKYTIRLTVANNIGCTSTASHDVMVLKSCYIAVPTGFTPNNDGLNDYLGPLNAYKTINLEFKVFNRMGNIVFATTDWQKKWDGRINGILQPSGTYVWYLTYTDTDTKKIVNMSGTSVLIR